MKFKKALKITISLIFIILCVKISNACSMYKLTINGKTMVGCNEDAWRTTPRIWFENARNSKEYGAGFTGSRLVGSNKTAPQSGMNEAGLTFSRLAAYYPEQNNPFPDRIKITDEVDYLTDILHKCATIEEVRKYIAQYDHSLFFDHVFIYIDSSGEYLIVEPYKLIKGNDPHYILSNFCPSITDNDQARKLERYRNGEDFLKTNEVNSSLSFCSTLSERMHVCRSRNGDGTLLTTIWNTRDKLVNLYFYHTFDTTIQFDLIKELEKGNHSIDIPELFPENLEFKNLEKYRTPFNTPELKVIIVIIAGFLIILSFALGISSLRYGNIVISLKASTIFAAINLLLVAYLFVLAIDKNIYYFDAPYKHYSSDVISASSYIPFVLILIIIPSIKFTIERLKLAKTRGCIKVILLTNNLIYLLLIISFSYWGLYNIWN